MGHEPQAHDRPRGYRVVGAVLFFGLLAAIAVMIVGFGLAAVRGQAATGVLPLSAEVPHLIRGDPNAVLDAGILLLFAAPLAGVVAALLELLAEGDHELALVAVAVLGLIAMGFLIALR